jgi:hypothetical protein
MSEPAPDLTLGEAAEWLDPPMTEEQLGVIIGKLPHLKAVGTRPRDKVAGRPPRTYDAQEIMRLHAALLPWL